MVVYRFFFIDTPTTQIYTLSLHDALPISPGGAAMNDFDQLVRDELNALVAVSTRRADWDDVLRRSEEHTFELQSHSDLVCRLLLEKKKASEVCAEPENKSGHGLTGERVRH